MAIKLFIQKDGEEPRELDFDGPVVRIGRGDDNHLVVDDARSSRQHCSVSETPQGAVLEDLGSSNGTRYKGKPVTRSLLSPGDKFEIGSTGFFFDRISEVEAAPLSPPMSDDSASSSGEPLLDPAPAETGGGEEEVSLEFEEVELPDAGGDPQEISSSGSAGDAALPEFEEAGDKSREPVDIQASAEGSILSLQQVVGELEKSDISVQSLPFSIGRSSSCDLSLDDQRASGHHAEIVEKDGVLAVVDLGSKNGVLVDERKVKKAGVIGDGSRFSIGSHIFDVRIEDPRLKQVSTAKADRQMAKRDEVSGKGEPADAIKLNVDIDSLGQGGSLQQLFSVLALVIIVGFIAYFCIDVASRILEKPTVDPAAEANRIGNWSFEDSAPEAANEAAVVGWKARGGARVRRVKDRGIRGGHYALELVGDSSGGAASIYSAAQENLARVTAGKLFLLEGFVTNRGAFLAGLMVEWLRDDEGDGEKLVGRSFSTPVRGGGGEVELDVSQVIRAPAGAASARISCFLMGPGTALFDQASFAPAQFEGGEDAAVDGMAHLEKKAADNPEPVIVAMQSPGIFSLRRNKRNIFSSFWAGLDASRDPNTIGPKLTDPDLRPGDDGSHIAMTVVPDLLERKWIDVGNRISSDSSSVSLVWALEDQGGKADSKRSLVLYFSSHDPELKLVAHGPRTGADFSLSKATGGPFDELVAGDGAVRTSMEFNHTVNIVARKHPIIAGRWLLVVQPADGDSELGVTFSHGSRREAQAARMVLAEADRLFGDGEASEALSLLEGLPGRYPLQEVEISRSVKRIEQWNSEAAKVVGDLDIGRDAYRSNPSDVIYRSLHSRGRLLAKRYSNTSAGKKVEGFLAELDAIRDSASAGRVKAKQEGFFTKAGEYMENQQFGMAGLYLQLLLEQAEKGSQLHKDAFNLRERLDTRREAVNKIKLGQ